MTIEELEAEQRASCEAMLQSDARIITEQEREISDLKSILMGYEQWEANLVLNANWEATPDGLPALTYPLYDELMELQGRRNEALGRGPFKRKDPASA